MIHELKTLPEYFDDVFMGHKTFEVRKNDRNFQQGDMILLKEWNGKEYTGREMARMIGYILLGGQFGIKEGYCVMAIL